MINWIANKFVLLVKRLTKTNVYRDLSDHDKAWLEEFRRKHYDQRR